VLVAATTHYPELKAFALSTPGVRNASMEFDSETLRPTFRLHVGLPGASNAFAIAERLGLDRAVLGRAGKHLSELHRSLERTLREAERQRTELAAALEEARVAAADASEATTDAEREAERVRDEAQRALRRARAEADELLLQARRALRQAEEARDRAAKRNRVDQARAGSRGAEPPDTFGAGGGARFGGERSAAARPSWCASRRGARRARPLPQRRRGRGRRALADRSRKRHGRAAHGDPRRARRASAGPRARARGPV